MWGLSSENKKKLNLCVLCAFAVNNLLSASQRQFPELSDQILAEAFVR
jgi:hypothetical protein